MGADPFGRAVRDFYEDNQMEPLLQRDGSDTLEHPIKRFYFEPIPADSDEVDWLTAWLDGPLLDVGAGAGRHALYFQERCETVAIDISQPLVHTMRDRGVEDARQADMFALPDSFDRNRFASILVHGTQVGLAKSMDGVRQFLSDLAYVTAPDATTVIDSYDPEMNATGDLLGYRSDPTPGLAFRVMTFEYEGDRETLLFRLFSPDRIRQATVGSPWRVAETVRASAEGSSHYRVALAKRDSEMQ